MTKQTVNFHVGKTKKKDTQYKNKVTLSPKLAQYRELLTSTEMVCWILLTQWYKQMCRKSFPVLEPNQTSFFDYSAVCVFFQPQHMTYQNPPNNTIKPSAASVWPKSLIFGVLPKASIPDAFSGKFRKNQTFFNHNIRPIKIHQIAQLSLPQLPFGPNRRFLTFRQKTAL